MNTRKPSAPPLEFANPSPERCGLIPDMKRFKANVDRRTLHAYALDIRAYEKRT
jgi:hypothetical protein